MAGEIEGQFFGADDDEAQGAELLQFGFAQVHTQESGRRQQERQLILIDQRRAFASLQRIWIRYNAHTFDERIPKGDRRSERVKKRQRAENGVAEIATRKFARLQQDSFAARPIVKLRSTGTLFARVTARFATIDALLAGKTIAIRSSENSFRR